uniref:Uncharacterized protein n=1 Tax=Zea mays TaxID=4577 RepID=C4J3P7_MAIZE|nr:unknown [Zea mays]ACR36759.1 unknown [Zea mays]
MPLKRPARCQEGSSSSRRAGGRGA